MSWAEEDWTVGLSGRVLQKVKELQVHHERLSRENKQKQLQLDNIHISLGKQSAKYEEVRGELQYVQRELQSVREEAKAAVISKERLTQEFQTKQAQVCSLEGQLDGTRTLNNKLTQEIKRLEAELEKLQNSSRADTTLFSTPCWNTPLHWEQNGRKDEERLGHREEAQSRAPHIRQRLQFSDTHTNSLPRQHKSTPRCHPSDQSESFSTPLAAFPWERDDTRQASRRESPSSSQIPSIDVLSQGQSPLVRSEKENHRTEADISLSEMQNRVSCLEEELSAKAKAMKSIQSDLVQSQKDLAARELSLQKARDELRIVNTRVTHESERASGAEQRLKQLQEELKCQRQNAESSRLQHQQRTKDLEKQHQTDLMELQKERQSLEKQHQQEVNKLNQELQQARALHNALQAQADKLSLQKQALDKELDALKEKLKWTEGQLQERQKKEALIQAKLAEALREAEAMAVSLEQGRKRERGLEEEGRRLTEERADALRLLKDLQEQKAVTAPSPQPVQFCPIGQSFSPQPAYTPYSQPVTYKRPTVAIRNEQKKTKEDVDERSAEITSYPSDREPGEGIDSEHITVLISRDSESLQREEHRMKSNEDETKARNEVIWCDSSGKKEPSSFDHTVSSSPRLAAGISSNTSVGADHHTLIVSAENTPSVKMEQASEELLKENAMLRSEIKDAREELQKRLEDLEAQRRAEAEARTRLKQLSRKHASQAVEKEDQEKELRTQLENERTEANRLRKAMATLEMEMNSRQKEKKEEGEVQKEEIYKALEDRESEMTELNIQLKKQLTEVKTQLAFEREERKREEEEWKQITSRDKDVKAELSTKLEDLRAELEEIKHNRNEVEKKEGKLSAENSPLIYMPLHDDGLNCNIVQHDNKSVLSPAQHLFYHSTNQLNLLVSQGTADLIQEDQMVIDSECSQLSNESQTGQMTSDLQDTRPLLGSSLSDQREDNSSVRKSLDLTREMEHLQKENTKETEHANQYKVKLEALQSQVTRQTKQLTMAFEKQSQHISGLLSELQEKESALLSQGEELQRCKQRLDALKAEKEVQNLGDEDQIEDTRDEKAVESPPTHFSCKEDNEMLLSGEQCPGSQYSNNTESNRDSACVMEEIECDQGELLALRQENQLLKQRIKGLTVSGTGSPTILSDSGNQEDQVKHNQNTGNTVLYSLPEQRPSCMQNDNTNEGPESLTQNEKGKEHEQEELKEVSHLQIAHLKQQVVTLQMKVQALSEETQQQAEELTLWRLTSQPAPTFDQFPSSKDNPDQNTAVERTNSHQQHTEEKTQMLPVQSPAQGVLGSSTVAVIREDELLLSCSSNKLQSHVLFSRLQHSNLPRPKSIHHCNTTAELQENSQDAGGIDKESEKENQPINFSQLPDSCPSQHKVKEEGQYLTKAPNTTKTAECHRGNTVFKPNALRETKEINTAIDFSERAVKILLKSVSSQTEDSLSPSSALAASTLHCAYTQTEKEDGEKEEEVELADSPPVTNIPLSETAGSGDKMFSGSFPFPADPARLADRIRRNRAQLSAAFDDTEYEPYGLPDVVMKGFADIPSGPSCPYIVRRGLLGTSAVPVTQKDQGPEEETD